MGGGAFGSAPCPGVLSCRGSSFFFLSLHRVLHYLIHEFDVAEFDAKEPPATRISTANSVQQMTESTMPAWSCAFLPAPSWYSGDDTSASAGAMAAARGLQFRGRSTPLLLCTLPRRTGRARSAVTDYRRLGGRHGRVQSERAGTPSPVGGGRGRRGRRYR